MKRFLFLFLIIGAAFLYSCSSGEADTFKLDPAFPDGASLYVRDIRVKGFTLDWTELLPEKGYEYAIAASYSGYMEDYETARDNGKIILDFSEFHMTGGTYKAKNMMPGKKYEIKIFVRAKGMPPAEYLKAAAELPFIDDAGLVSVFINGNEALYDKNDDSFSYRYLLGSEEGRSYKFTYEPMRGCSLYIGEKKAESAEIPLKPNEPLEVTVVNNKTLAARDYTVYAEGTHNEIPIVIINTRANKTIHSKEQSITANMQIIDCKAGFPGISIYDGEIEIRGRGNSSWGMPKKGYNFETSEKTGILDMAPSRDWLLIANYADKSLMRNYAAYEFSRDLEAAFAPKMRFVDLILNGEYMGNYLIGERVKIDKGRLDLPKIKSSTSDEYELTGSYVLEINWHLRLHAGEKTFTSKKIRQGMETVWGVAEGDTVVIRQPGADNLPKAAYDYIRDYFNEAEDALFGGDFKDPKKGYRAYLDTASFVDWYLINEFYKNVDGDFRLSTFLYKPRGDKLHMGPVWDLDLGAGNADYRDGDNPEGWYVRTSFWYGRLFEDEAFALEFKDRWNYLKNNGYFDVFFKRIDETAKTIEKSALMNFKKWNILGKYDWPNGGNWRERKTYQNEVDYLKQWLTLRFYWMDKEINK